MSAPHITSYPDLLLLNSTLTDEQRLVMRTVREFIQREMEPKIRLAYRNEEFPVEAIPKMGAMGLLGSTIEGMANPPVDPICYGLMMRELERCDSGLRSFSSVQGGLVMYPISSFGSVEQKREWLSKLGAGTAIGCFGLTESEGD